MNIPLNERRALLRQALEGTNPTDVTGFAASVEHASEEDRAALAKTLPPSRLFKAEGPTPRAIFVLAALGKPKLLAETIGEPNVIVWSKRSKHGGSADTSQPALTVTAPALDGIDDEKLAPLRAALIAGASERRRDWAEAYIDGISGSWWSGLPLSWPAVRALVARHGLIPESVEYLRRLVYMLTGSGPAIDAARTVAALRAEPRLLSDEFWMLFRVEGAGALYQLIDEQIGGRVWAEVIQTLTRTEPGFRERLLDESLAALLRDFSARNIIWYPRVHRAIDPTPAEIAGRVNRYLAVLGTMPGTAVGLAQDMLLRAVKAGALDTDAIDALIEASGAVLGRTEKTLIKAQLTLLTALDANAAQRQAISSLVSGVIDALAPDMARIARKLVLEADAASPVTPAPAETGPPVTVPGPRLTALPETGPSPHEEPIADEDTLFTLLAEQLEGTGNGADLPRILAYLTEHLEITAPQALRARAAEIIKNVWDSDDASPRRHLAAIVAGDATEAPEFRGYARYVVLGHDEAAPEGVFIEEHAYTSHTQDPETGEWKIAQTWTSRSGNQYLPTDAPTGLLAETLQNVRRARRSSNRITLPAPVPPQKRTWKRAAITPGEGRYGRELEVLGGAGPRALWRVTAEQGFSGDVDSIERRALNVTTLAAEFTFRAQEARGQDGYEQIVQWTAWLLRHNPDTFAAHFHPALYAAAAVINVRGIDVLLAALGASRQVPGGPVYSALALGLSAKEAPHRAQAAEAVATLANNGLLDPGAFAIELAAHLADGFIMAGRIAPALDDAASISALAGYRVLQTLITLLPSLADTNQAGKLVELTARLANDYGTPVAVPVALAARRKGASVLALAIRALEAVTPRPTALAEEAAEQARAVVS